jgi:hypothetical protein
MNTSATKSDPIGVDARIDDEALHVRLSDGRELTVPMVWFPRLAEADRATREHWRWGGGGVGMHWPDLDEDLSIRGLLARH